MALNRNTDGAQKTEYSVSVPAPGILRDLWQVTDRQFLQRGPIERAPLAVTTEHEEVLPRTLHRVAPPDVEHLPGLGIALCQVDFEQRDVHLRAPCVELPGQDRPPEPVAIDRERKAPADPIAAIAPLDQRADLRGDSPP